VKSLFIKFGAKRSSKKKSSNPNASIFPVIKPGRTEARSRRIDLLRRSDKSQVLELETDQKIKFFIMASNEEQTCTIPEDLEEAPAQILETHCLTTLVHEMKVDGYHLVERKQKTNFNPKASDDTPKMTIIIHSRSIDDRCYDVQETLAEGMDEPERVIKTEMTQEEVERFEEDWSNLWNPQAKADSLHFD
jgi:hypothetical protein